jgi:hypothetical protein
MAVFVWFRDPGLDELVAANDRVGRARQHAGPRSHEVRRGTGMGPVNELMVVYHAMSSGKLTIETGFYDGQQPIGKTVYRIYYV